MWVVSKKYWLLNKNTAAQTCLPPAEAIILLLLIIYLFIYSRLKKEHVTSYFAFLKPKLVVESMFPGNEGIVREKRIYGSWSDYFILMV